MLQWHRLATPLVILVVAGCSERSAVGPEPHALALAATAAATVLTVSVTDPIGDHTGSIDVTRMWVDFDPSSGEYEIALRAAPSEPFTAAFRVNINLFNADDASFFQDAVNDFQLEATTTTLILSGVSLTLTGWDVGDQVFTNSLGGTPNPPGTSLFRSAVMSLPFAFLTNEDFIAFGDRRQPTIVQILTPEIRVQRLVADVKDLVDAGTLPQDQAGGLLDKLSAVLDKIASGRIRATINQLVAFINQVKGFVNAGALPETEGQQLQDAAQAVIDQLSG